MSSRSCISLGFALAIYQFHIRSLSRAKGANAVAAAAYIARDKLRDEQHGRTYNFRRRGGLEHAEILVPLRGQAAAPSALPQRADLWNQAERAERRRDSRVAREYQFSLPHELNAEDRIALARRFAQHIADRYGGAVDLAVHRAPAGGDRRNVHAHILSTTREYHADGLGRKTDIEISHAERRARALPRSADEYRLIRASWAEYANEALRERGLSARIDHRSLAAQGIDRRPRRHLGASVTAILRRGGYSLVAERIQAEEAADRTVVLENKRLDGKAHPAMSLEGRRREALASWQNFREEQRKPEAQAKRAREPHESEREPGRTADREFER
jgi:ATP-dependent exoDNAse (exonuclease V) alpha subunit